MRLQLHLIAAMALAYAGVATAAVTADEAKKLGTTLTAVGAEKAANAAGTIPAYTGGNTSAPAGFKAGDGLRPDPFAAEKPLFSVDGKNAGQHGAALTEGAKALLKAYPTFRMDVYKTHRTVAFPKFVAENTLANATRAKTTNEGRSMVGAHAGFPFPIPANGYEAMWNHLVRFNGVAYEAKYRNLNVDASGRASLSTEGFSTQEYPFYAASRRDPDTYCRKPLTYRDPARRATEGLLTVEPPDLGNQHRSASI